MNWNLPQFFRLKLSLWGELTAAGAIACAGTLIGFLGRFHWFLDLFSHFRIQYLVGLCILAIIFSVRRRWKIAISFFVFACINLPVFLPLYFASNSAFESALSLRAVLLNVNTNFGDTERVKFLINHIKLDIVVLEEINSMWVQELQEIANVFPYSIVKPRDDNFGIGLFSNLPITDHQILNIGDAGVPSIVAKLDTGQGLFSIMATHPLPPVSAFYSRMRNNQLENIPDCIPSALPVILFGDLNVTPWNYYFKRLLKRSRLVDSSLGNGIQPTWPTYIPFLSIPIDHCLHSKDITVVRREVGQNAGSDHYPLIVDFAIHTRHP